MYKAIELFTDLQDDNYRYDVGDEYPRQGLKPTKKRINELLSDSNRRHRPVIEEVVEEDKKAAPKKGGKKANAK